MSSTSSSQLAREESETLFSAYERILGGRSSSKELDNDGFHDTQVRSNGRFFDITEHWTSQDEPGEIIPTGQSLKIAALSTRRYGEHSLLLRRIHIPDQAPKIQLEIQSTTLQRAFRAVTGNLGSMNVKAAPIIIPAPFHELYHFREELEAMMQKADSDLARELKLFKDFEAEHISRTIDLKQIEYHKKHETISYEYLWSIFKPHELILLQNQIANNLVTLACGVMQKFSRDPEDDKWYIQIQCMAFNGEHFGPVTRYFGFAAFPGVVDIKSLPAYPLSFCKEASTVKAALLERGKAFIQLCRADQPANTQTKPSGCLREYQGPVWVQQQDWEAKGMEFFDDPQDTASGRVLIDPAGFMEEKPMFRERIIKPSDPSATPSVSRADFNDDDLITFPAMIAGYSLSGKHVGYFDVGSFKDVNWEVGEAQHMYENSNVTKTIMDISSGFQHSSRTFEYSIHRKGKGLVFLFHGRPGTGKTLTAECMAEMHRRPLYRVSAADLGSSVTEVERNLQLAFRRISRWNAILLLDEADILMARRGDDTDDNSLVSVLLRLLEYQSGIVILTTNRVQIFDEAILSRIHVNIHFPDLGPESREIVWRRVAEQSVETTDNKALSDDDFLELAKLKLDGRSISNAYHVAKLYASGQANASGGSVSKGDLQAVLPFLTGNDSPELRKQVEDFCSHVRVSDSDS